MFFFRYASIFLQPVTNEIAPNYSSIVLRPMDLSTLKRNVENGVVSVLCSVVMTLGVLMASERNFVRGYED